MTGGRDRDHDRVRLDRCAAGGHAHGVRAVRDPRDRRRAAAPDPPAARRARARSAGCRPTPSAWRSRRRSSRSRGARRRPGRRRGTRSRPRSGPGSRLAHPRPSGSRQGRRRRCRGPGARARPPRAPPRRPRRAPARVTGSPPRGSRSPYVVPLSYRARPRRAAVSRITRVVGEDELRAHLDDPAGGQLAATRPCRPPGHGPRTRARRPRPWRGHRPRQAPRTRLPRRSPAFAHRSPAGGTRATTDHRPVRGRSPRSRLDSGRAAGRVARDPWRLRVGARPRLGPVAEGLARPVRAPDPERARRRVDRGRRDRGRDDRGRERAARGEPPRWLRGHPAELGEPVHHRAVRRRTSSRPCGGCRASPMPRAGAARRPGW